jgi:hypothetical protein
MERLHMIRHSLGWKSRLRCLAAALLLIVGVSACTAPGYYMPRGALIGAGAGALIGQGVGRNTNTTLLGAGAGSLIGGFAGYLCDQMAIRRVYQPIPSNYKHSRTIGSSPQGYYSTHTNRKSGANARASAACPYENSW